MYAPLPEITEALDELEAQQKRERDGQRRLRLHLLVLFRSGQVQTRQEAAAHLAVHRNTIGRWLAVYEQGGLDGLLEIHTAGAKPGQKTLSPALLAALEERLREDGFSGYLEVQRWLADEYALEVPYSTVHKLVRYGLKAKLKRARGRRKKRGRHAAPPRSLRANRRRLLRLCPPAGVPPRGS
jgi:transposase